jgi:hypothetical protein
LAGAAASADSDAMSAEVDRILHSSADGVRTMFRGFDEKTMMAFAGISAGGEFEELEVLEHLARSEGGREIVAASCRKAINEEDTVLRMLAYNMLADIDKAAASSMLPEMYETIADDDIFLLAAIAGNGLYINAEDETDIGNDELYALIERDLRGGDKAASLKAAKLVAMMHTDPVRELALVGLENSDPEVRRWCVLSILTSYFSYDEEESSPTREVVEKALADEDATVRSFAARQVGMMGNSDYLPVLYELLEDKDVGVRRAAATAVNMLIGYSPEGVEAPKKLLLKRLHKETDGVTRCYLGETYGVVTADPEGPTRYLSDDGYWAFYSGEWNEKDIDGYFEEYTCDTWGG